MQKNKNNNKNQAGSSVEKVPADALEAAELHIHNKDNSLVLRPLNRNLVLEYFKETLISRTICQGDTIHLQLHGLKHAFEVQKITHFGVVGAETLHSFQFYVSKRSRLVLANNAEEIDRAQQQADQQQQNQGNEIYAQQNIPQSKLIGVRSEIQQLRKLALMALTDVLQRRGVTLAPVRGVLICGASGTGKSALAKSFLSDRCLEQADKALLPAQTCLQVIHSHELLSRVVGEGEKRIQSVFQLARQRLPAPSVLLFEDLELVCNSASKSERGTACALSAEFDRLAANQNDKILVLATVKDGKSLDEQLRRAGRFEKEIKLELPNWQTRLQILHTLLQLDSSSSSSEIEMAEVQTNLQTITKEYLENFAQSLHGYTQADVVALVREAHLNAALRDSEHHQTTVQDLEQASQSVGASGMKEVLMEIPKVLWNEIGGYDSVKKQVMQVVEWPLKHADAFARLGIAPSKGVLLYGPPGCSKTMVAKAIATESKLNFFAVKGPELFSKYVGDSEKAIRTVFRRARSCAPSVVFFDEIDAIASQRSSADNDVQDRVLCQLLNELDGIESLQSVVIIAATNRPDILDKALTRPGRFDHLVYVPPPDNEARKEILRINTRKMPLAEDVYLETIVGQTQNFSGAEIALVCRQAGLNALSRSIEAKSVINSDFQQALKKIKPRITQEMLSQYYNFANQLQRF